MTRHVQYESAGYDLGKPGDETNRVALAPLPPTRNRFTHSDPPHQIRATSVNYRYYSLYYKVVCRMEQKSKYEA